MRGAVAASARFARLHGARRVWAVASVHGEARRLARLHDLIGERFDSRAREWKKRWPLIGDVRGLGAMRALELVRPGTAREPAKEETEQVLRHCLEHGLILVSAGSYGNVVRLLMPLVVTDEQFDEGLHVLEGALMHVAESVEAMPHAT